jgi:hypothetical protein
MHNQNCTSWPEVELPQGWKRNPHVGQRLNWILLLTVIVAGGVTLLSAGKSEVLPAVCFLALVALPIAGPALARVGCGTNSREARELHTLTPEDARLDEAGCLVRYGARIRSCTSRTRWRAGRLLLPRLRSLRATASWPMSTCPRG